MDHAGEIIQRFHSEVKIFYDKTKYENTCNDFEKSIPEYCEGIKKNLGSINNKFSVSQNESKMQNDCIFIEEACSEKFKEECNNLKCNDAI
ncbi:hypothetical protein PMAC_002144 [Pneumocystis sp. 'macacae']|nr:hypothetical protein PMAC_002144 [Pneumocystis sp. 'macacae']